MPRYRPEADGGYDLTLELPFTMFGRRKCQVGSAGSLMLMCPKCGRTKFRIQTSGAEDCFGCDGIAVPVALDDLAELDKVNPIITTVEQRKAARLEEEALRPWNWVFGDLTEADFPEGFAEIGGQKVEAYQRLKAEKETGK